MLRIVPLLYPVLAAHTSIFRIDSNPPRYRDLPITSKVLFSEGMIAFGGPLVLRATLKGPFFMVEGGVSVNISRFLFFYLSGNCKDV